MEPLLYCRRNLLVFELSGLLAAFAVEEVERIAPMAELAAPPGLPSALEGILNLAGVAIPVLRLDRLFALPTQRVGLYSMLVILRTSAESSVAVLVDRVRGILPVTDEGIHGVDPQHSFNGCSEATVTLCSETVHVLSPDRMILTKEHNILSEFQVMAQRRLNAWNEQRVVQA